ncbi:hypothetical protein [Mycolicibacterium fluoranthenivorans]|jgi:hypothetical protein|nr:hypothetical protein [Mycolicibacterium fluoranthenivorans]
MSKFKLQFQLVNQDVREGSAALKFPGIGDAIQLIAASAAIVYVALFIGYRKYYNTIGIRPEDVGVDSSFIFFRSIGFILIISAIVVIATLLFLVSRPVEGDRDNKKYPLMIAAICLLYCVVVTLILFFVNRQGWQVGLAASLICSCFVILGSVVHRILKKRIAALVTLLVVAVVVVLLPSLLVYKMAEVAAKGVLENHRVNPQLLFGVPLLDVSADHVQGTWRCDEAQRPEEFGSDFPPYRIVGLLVGESDDDYYIFPSDRTRVPEWAKAVVLKIPRDCLLVKQFVYGN